MTALPPGYRTVAVPADRLAEFRTTDQLAFAVVPDPEVEESLPFPIPQDRTMAVEAPDGTFAAVHGSYEFAMPVPGRRHVPCAGLTWVAVRPDQRRRGPAARDDRDAPRAVAGARGARVGALRGGGRHLRPVRLRQRAPTTSG